MKKILYLLLISATIFCLTGCGNGESKDDTNSKSLVSKTAAVINKEGNTENLTAKELCSVYDDNSAKFKKYYAGAEISFIGTISKVESHFREGSSSTLWDSITFNEGFKVYLPYDVYDIADLSKGDVIYVKSNIYSGFACDLELDLRGTGGSEGYSTSSLKTTVIKNLNGMNSSDVENLKKIIEEEKKLYNSLEIVESKLTFISKYAGNTSNSGSKQFDDTFMDEFIDALNVEVNLDLLESNHSGLKNKLQEIQTELKVIYDLVIDMGKTNSDKNVSTIKSNASSTLVKVQDLMKEMR